MSASLSSESNPEVNMTPVLDMVFQLITFFMLVVNFSGAAMDQSLQLPVLGTAQPLDPVEGESLLVLNIDLLGHLKVYGGEQKDPAAYIASEGRSMFNAARVKQPKLKPGDELPTMVVVRADTKTSIDKVNDIITICQKNGFKKFSFRAMSKTGS